MTFVSVLYGSTSATEDVVFQILTSVPEKESTKTYKKKLFVRQSSLCAAYTEEYILPKPHGYE